MLRELTAARTTVRVRQHARPGASSHSSGFLIEIAPTTFRIEMSMGGSRVCRLVPN